MHLKMFGSVSVTSGFGLLPCHPGKSEHGERTRKSVTGRRECCCESSCSAFVLCGRDTKQRHEVVAVRTG
jgi:hypothetical protein